MSRLLVLMGSGETTPTMVEPHKRVAVALGPDPDAVLVDTPYGFQENADELTRRTIDYFDHHVGLSVAAVSLRDADAASAAERGAAAARVEAADWVFAGPGSPTYLRHHWTAAGVVDAVRRRLARPGATVFASAAACTVGRRTVPVYEVYKVGQPPHWQDGFDLTAELGLDCVVIPHFDNAEGGTHDTRYCYLGERRLAAMEDDLDDATWVLGVDEHTALVVDLDAGTTRIEGRGGVTVRVRGRHVVFPAGSAPTLDDLRAAARGERRPNHGAAPADATEAPGGPDTGTESVLLDEVAALEARFDAALADGDAELAAAVVVELEELLHAWLADPNQTDEADRGRQVLHRLVARLGSVAQTGLHDHEELVTPLVDELVDLRARARASRDFDTGDRIRDALGAAGVEVRDTPDGAEWDYDDPAS